MTKLLMGSDENMKIICYIILAFKNGFAQPQPNLKVIMEIKCEKRQDTKS